MTGTRSLLLAFLCLLAIIGFSQPNQINFTSITVKDGLLSNSIYSIIKDRYGLMWFATTDGLNKYDGTNFTVYRNNPDDSTSLRTNEVLALHEDRAGNLWVGTGGGGLSMYNRQKNSFDHYIINYENRGLTGNAVIKAICSDYRGWLWIAQYGNLFVMNPATRSVSEIILRDANGDTVQTVVYSLFEDSKRNIWIGSENGLFRYNIENNTCKIYTHRENDASSLASDQVRAIAEDRSGTIWVGTRNGLCKLLPGEQSFYTYKHKPDEKNSLSNDRITCLVADDEGLLWIGTLYGLNAMNTSTGKISNFYTEEGNIFSLNSKSINCAYYDKEGIYWFGSFMRGISKYDKNINLFGLKLGTTFTRNGGPTAVTSFAENRNGTSYIATFDAGLFEFNHKTGHVQPRPIKLKGKPIGTPPIVALHYTRQQRLYVGTYGLGVLILNTETGEAEQLQTGYSPGTAYVNDVFAFTEDSQGNIWVGTNGGGVYVVKDNKVIAKYTPKPCGGDQQLLPINGYIRDIEEDADKNIWIATHGGGIAVFNPGNKQWTIYSQVNGQLPSDKVQSILCDSEGRIWIGTDGGGLALFDKEKNQFRRFTERDGLQNTTVHQIVEDDDGRLWLSTNTGISSLDPVMLKFRNFNSYYGVQNGNFFHGSGIRLTDGSLLFGGLEGINYFHPNQFTINQNVPQVLFTDLKISNRSVVAGDDAPIKEHISIAKEIKLDYKQNFALSFVALNYTLAKQNQYAYKLVGFDKDWNYTGTNNTAVYTNLDPGHYTFLVKASNNDGVWNTSESKIEIFVRPPFWRTTVAYVFYVLAIAGILLYSRYRVIAKMRRKFKAEQEQQEIKRQQELDRLKLKFLTNLSHDLRTPIALISGPIDQLIEGEKASAKLDKLYIVRRNAKRLLNLVNQLLDFRKMEEQELTLKLCRGEFVSFVKEILESFKDLSERKHINYSFSSTIPRFIAMYDHDKLERILFNILSNAFKFTLEGGSISVVLEESPMPSIDNKQWVRIKITDSGIGIPKETIDRIFDRFFQNKSSAAILNYGAGIGLSIAREFVKMHGGTIEVESEPGNGSTFTIHLPLEVVPESSVELPAALPATEKTVKTKKTNGKLLPMILVVEDNDDFRFYLKDNLRNNYTVIEAANGREGWQKALAHHPQLIITDVSMPEVDGIEMVNKLKADKRTKHIPVIMLTVITDPQQQIRGLETGANDYLTKPFDFEVLSAKIKNLLELKTVMQNTYAKQISLSTPDPKIDSSDEVLLKEIARFLDQNITNPQLSVETLSKQFGMSRSTLYTRLLQITGKTPVEYIRSFRLERATRLMEKSNMTIAEIAYHVGFTTPNYFARSFKQKFDMLPSEYIAMQRKEWAEKEES